MYKLEIHRIVTSEDKRFAEFFKIYSESFPLNERRTPEQQKVVLKAPGYQLDLYLSDEKVIGFIGWWRSQEFVFAEHFAIAPEFREKGLGSAVLKQFIEEMTIPVILEIELPVDELTRRRLRFYESAGFFMNKHLHFQPPYHSGDQPIQMNILTWKNQISDKLYLQFSQFQKNKVKIKNLAQQLRGTISSSRAKEISEFIEKERDLTFPD